MFPLASIHALGKVGLALVEILIGIGFAFGLEISGFSNSYVLTGQFYFRNGRVIKAMFTAILVAMVLIFASVAVGLLDYDVIWVDPTYLWPGVVGGALMGIGIIIGGYCPGTSIVSSTALKKDAWFFVLGGLVGTFLFSETERLFHYFYNSSFYGRVTLMDVFHVSAGVVVFVMAIIIVLTFWLNEWAVNKFKREDTQPYPTPRWAPIATVVVLLAAAGVWAIWPNWQQRWNQVAATQEPLLQQREVQISPYELATTINKTKTLQTVIVDVRDDYSYNLFHLRWSRHIPLDELLGAVPEFRKMAKETPATVFVIVSNGEDQATQAWKMLVAEKVPNVYLLAGGLNDWIKVFGEKDMAEGKIMEAKAAGNTQLLDYYFAEALGDRYRAADMLADPDNDEIIEKIKDQFVPKIKVKGPTGPAGGGCG
ncbi:MAG TPA: hypothetical protein ENJ54_10290 [Chloroflexi bacterium]|nr:hypothetical protein [Chloroflexota bacterium]